MNVGVRPFVGEFLDQSTEEKEGCRISEILDLSMTKVGADGFYH